MYVHITSYPSLDSVTRVDAKAEEVTFHVLVISQENYGSLEVEIWHNLNDSSEWSATALSEAPSRDLFKPLPQESGRNRRRSWYTGTLQNRMNGKPASFTIRFRLPGEKGWRWARDQLGAGDGLLTPSPSTSEFEDRNLSEFFDGTDSALEIQNVPSETPHTTLWSLKATAPPAQDDVSGNCTYALGSPLRFVRWFALIRLWSPWLAPRQGRSAPFAEKDAILYCFLRNDGLNVAALAISGVKDVLSVFRCENDEMVVHSLNDRESTGPVEVAIAVGASFQEAVSAVVYYARELVTKLSPVEPDLKALAESRRNKADKDVQTSWIEDWYDGLTYCTWNGLGQNLTEQAILGAIESLKKEDILITNLIIDDNWQSLDNEGQSQFKRGWTDFEANPKAFPNGLDGLTSAIRSKFQNIKHIAVWHALLGYWGGISPNGNIAKTYKTREVVKRDSVVGGSMTVVDAPDVKQMYEDFYSFLARSGVDSAKTDAQFFLDEITSASARRELISTYVSTWKTAQLRYLSGKAISCMSQTPQILFQSQLPNDSPPIPVRNSDDFFPDIEDSHTWHIFCNSHNSLLTKHLNVLPDWDMFQTNHKWAGFHAAARCISGGPISVTDTPGKHDINLIRQMTAKTTRGNTVILRPSVVGRSVEAYVRFEDEKLHKITAYNGDKDTGCSFLAIFNLRDFPITEIVHMKDFMGTSEGKYIVRSHVPGNSNADPPLTVMSQHDQESSLFGVTLDGHSWKFMTAFPVWGPYNVSDQLQELEIANLGLLYKLTGAAAIVNTSVDVTTPSHTDSDQTRSKVRISTGLKALGILGIWISNLRTIDWKNRILVVIEGVALPLEFAHVSEHAPILELDIGRAWKELNLDSGWSNEVELAVYIQ